MSIAVVSLACRFPDADNPAALWANVLAGRRSFRRIPPERLDLAQYTAERVGAAESITQVRAGLLVDWRFDSGRFKIPQTTFETTDLTHWLALEVATEAIERAGGVAELDRARTAVVVANTLAGEFSRASLMRLRAPFLDELLNDAMSEGGLDATCAADVRGRFLARLRERFPDPQEDTLAGGLANTIAGRVANYFDLHGGAYSVDAACASSLVAIANAAELLCSGAAGAVVVGAVDLSLDPFELVGFSRNGALASSDMRVFDARPTGFWPGEGAGFAVLMLADEARRRALPVRATLRGWGISSDGAGGLTRPAVSGQVLALTRAHERASIDAAELGYVEAHGTGTAVGDPVEVRALATVRNGAAAPLPIGSIKANIGHTKAAAGFAGLIKAIAALEAGVIPPHVGCNMPHPAFAEVDHKVYPALLPQAWPGDGVRLAGVSGFGFGGVNAHIVIEHQRAVSSRTAIPAGPRRQDAELFAFAGSAGTLAPLFQSLAARAATMSLAELSDAAAACARDLGSGPLRVAIIAKDPEQLRDKLARAAQAISADLEILDGEGGVFVARGKRARIGYLFPGQAAPSRPGGGAWARRFDDARDLAGRLPQAVPDPVDTRIAQPAIAAASLTAWRLLRRCGIEANVACGHSLGEISALVWAGVLREDNLIPLVAARGAIMADAGRHEGGMLRVEATAAEVLSAIDGLGLVLACHNAPREVVISGGHQEIGRAEQRLRNRRIATTRLSVSDAFHSSMMAPAVPAFSATLAEFEFAQPQRTVWSTVTGDRLSPGERTADLLARQIVMPVLFEQALRGIASQADILIEIGPGAGLSRLAQQAGLTAISVDAFADSLKPLLDAIGLVFVASGQAVNLAPLFEDRPLHPFDLTVEPRFLANPCGRRKGARPQLAPIAVAAPAVDVSIVPASSNDSEIDIPSVVRNVLAEETGFAMDDIRDDDRFLDDLHLNSIAVARIVGKAARLIGCRMPDAPTEFANATARELMAGLAALRDLAPKSAPEWERVPGVRPWVRTFEVRWTERIAPQRATRDVRWRAVVIQGDAQDHAAARMLASPPPTGDSASAEDGLLIWIGATADVQSSYDLFAACRAAWPETQVRHIAICHAGAPVAAFGRSLALEGRFQSVLVVERGDEAVAPERVSAELARTIEGFDEMRIGSNGASFEPHFELVQPDLGEVTALTARDVILITGGTKGIASECALRLAGRTKAALVFCGRSPASDSVVASTLERARALGARCHYFVVDVLDAEGLARGVKAAVTEFGAITALIHAAGINEPKLFQEIDDPALRRLLAPKTAGLLAAVEAAGPQLRYLVTFGSILGRMGLKGETHYALANAWQSILADEIARTRRQCRVLSLEWSIWNGAGMGHRHGSLERLARYGVDAIALDDGVDAFEALVMAGASGTLIVTSRFGPPDYVSLGSTELPILRFIDNIVLHYPRLELVVETELSLGRDPYLGDHRIDGVAILPAVMGLEAMAQAAHALAGGAATSVLIEDVSFRQATAVPDRGATRIKIVALADQDQRIEVVIRSEDDGFATDRMRARFRFDAPAAARGARLKKAGEALIDAQRFYGPLFFQGESFRRLQAYSLLSARRLAASLLPMDCGSWFATFEAQRLILGDPGVRDALLHALQAAVPHLRVIPVSVERIENRQGTVPVRMEAVETSATADTFVFDIVAFDAADCVVESWTGARFQAIGDSAFDSMLADVPELAAAYIERVARAATRESSLEVALIAESADDLDARRARALAALAIEGPVLARADGKPVALGHEADRHVSIAHCNGLTLAVKAQCEVGCDVERVEKGLQPNQSYHLSTPAQTLARDLTAPGLEPWATAAARVWTLYEVAIKQHGHFDLPWRIDRLQGREVVIFETLSGRTATIHMPGLHDGVVFAIGTRSADIGSVPASPGWMPAKQEHERVA
ncbi:MAG: SDR family NAD(P)-dependent oxidoreductase [Xanthobacteraceae bacterium]